MIIIAVLPSLMMAEHAEHRSLRFIADQPAALGVAMVE
jgi:hypothetical protein